MSQPRHVPAALGKHPREGLLVPGPDRWTPDRPAELGPNEPAGAGRGWPGPDQGYALTLARRFEDRLVLAEGEHRHDVVAGCLTVALKRASAFGRAPVIHDWTVALTVWGFLAEAPEGLVALRRPLFEGVAHHYFDQRKVADRVPEATLRLPHGEVVARFPSRWQELLGI